MCASNHCSIQGECLTSVPDNGESTQFFELSKNELKKRKTRHLQEESEVPLGPLIGLMIGVGAGAVLVGFFAVLGYKKCTDKNEPTDDKAANKDPAEATG